MRFGVSHNARQITVRFDGGRTHVITAENPDVAMGYTESERARAVRGVISGRVSFGGVNYSFATKNVLKTDAPVISLNHAKVDGDATSGYLADGQAVVIPELWYTTALHSTYRPARKSTTIVKSARPLLMYFIDNVDVDKDNRMVYIQAPNFESEDARFIGTIKTKFGVIPVFTTEGVSGSSDDVGNENPDVRAEPEVTNDSMLTKGKVDKLVFGAELLYNESSIPFIVSQHMLTHNGLPLNGIHQLLIIKVLAYCDMMQVTLPSDLAAFVKDGILQVPLEESNGKLIIQRQAEVVFRKYTDNHAVIKRVFTGISATEDSILIFDGSNYGALVSVGKTATCFALSYSYLITVSNNLPLYSQIEYISSQVRATRYDYQIRRKSDNNAVPRGLFIEDGTVVGYTYDSIPDVALEGSHLDIVHQKTAVVKFKDIIVGTSFILGYDPGVTSKRDGPEHYIVVRKVEPNKIICEYDPQGDRGYSYGDDVTALLKHTDVVLKIVQSEVVPHGKRV